MKAGSDNFRASSVQGDEAAQDQGHPVVVYEPVLEAEDFFGSEGGTRPGRFSANATSSSPTAAPPTWPDVEAKVYTRDLYKLELMP